MYTHSDNDYRMELLQNKGKFVKRDHDKFNQLAEEFPMKARKWWFDEMELDFEFIRNDKQIQGIVENHTPGQYSCRCLNAGIDLKKKDFFFEGLDFDSGTGYAYSTYNFTDSAKIRYDWEMNSILPFQPMAESWGVTLSDGDTETLYRQQNQPELYHQRAACRKPYPCSNGH